MAEVLTPTWASGQNYLQIIDCGCCGVDAHRRTEGGGKLRQLVWPFRNQTKKVALSAATCEFQKGKLQNGLASMQALTGQMTFRAEGARRQRDSRWSLHVDLQSPKARSTSACEPLFLWSFCARACGVRPAEFFAALSAPHFSRASTISALFSSTAAWSG